MSNQITYQVLPHEKFTRFLTTPIQIEKVFAPKSIMNSEIARIEGYFDVEYPVRTAFIRNNRLADIPYIDEGFSDIYTPFENDRVDFTNFISTPHKLYTYAKTTLSVDTTGDYAFLFRTCGAAIIWVNGKRQFEFSPYTRNHYSEKQLVLPLSSGANEITIYVEDLAERDVNFYFELINDSDFSLSGYVDIDISYSTYQEIEQLLYGAYLKQDIFTHGEILLHTGGAGREADYPLRIKVNPKQSLVDDGAQDGNITDFEVNDIHLFIQRDQEVVSLGSVSEIPTAGFTRFQLSIPLNEHKRIVRYLTCSIYDEEKFSTIIKGDSVAKRKQEALEYYADLELEDINVALVNAALGRVKNKNLYAEYNSAFRLIEEKGDCADFILAPLLAVYSRYRQNFPEDFHDRIKDVSTNFRYWIDEPGNDVMWYFSENHALLFHVSQYLAGHAFANETFTVSRRMGGEQYSIGKRRLEDWFERFFEVGFSEWNSTTYFPIDFIGFFSLYIAAPDEEIKQLAVKALDYTFKLIAINYHGGTMASTYGRVYEHNLKAMKLGEISSLIEIAWGAGYFNNSLRAAALFSLTDYEPPAELEDILGTRDGQIVSAEYLQGDNEALTYLYKRKEYAIASTVNYMAYQRGHQQHVLNISLGECTMLWINQPGEAEFSGGNRPSYWAGNDAMPLVNQFKNVAFMHYDLSEVDYKFVHLYLPFWDLDEVVEADHWVFIRKSDAYVAVFFSEPMERSYASAIHGREIKVKGEDIHIIVKVSSAGESGSFDHFIAGVKQSSLHLDSHGVTYEDAELGLLEFRNDLKINGSNASYNQSYEILYKIGSDI